MFSWAPCSREADEIVGDGGDRCPVLDAMSLEVKVGTQVAAPCRCTTGSARLAINTAVPLLRQQQVTRAQAAIDNDVSAESLEVLEKKEGPDSLTLTIEGSDSLTTLDSPL